MKYKIELQLKIYPNDKILLIEWERIHFHESRNIKLELGMETLFQLSGQLILFLNTISDTKTSEGLKEVFKHDEDILRILLQMSLGWSLISCVLAHVKGLSARRIYFPIKSKMIVMLYALLASTMRVLSFIVFYTPAFGLFSVLQHLKLEQMPWHPDLKNNFVKNYIIQFGNSSAIDWNNIDRWQTDEHKKSIPPSLTLYTVFTLKQYFYIFWTILIIQAGFVFYVKWKFTRDDFLELNILEKIIHVVENCSIPCNVLEWENIKTGNSDAHKKRMKDNLQEVLLIITVNFIFNCILVIPLCILGKRNVVTVVKL